MKCPSANSTLAISGKNEKKNDNCIARHLQKMKTSKSSYYWLALFAICFITYQQIIDRIRPNYSGDSITVKYLLGIAPNFFPAIGIPSLFVVLIPQMKLKNKWLNENKYITAEV